jgi:hypothetical protein
LNFREEDAIPDIPPLTHGKVNTKMPRKNLKNKSSTYKKIVERKKKQFLQDWHKTVFEKVQTTYNHA